MPVAGQFRRPSGPYLSGSREGPSGATAPRSLPKGSTGPRNSRLVKGQRVTKAKALVNPAPKRSQSLVHLRQLRRL